MDEVQDLLKKLVFEPSPERQKALASELGYLGSLYRDAMLIGINKNPFFKIDFEFGDALSTPNLRDVADWQLLQLRLSLSERPGTRVAVFCMPKSGSSFVQSAISHALKIPNLTLTSTPDDGGYIASHFGINGREQELDELAILLQIVRGRGSFVAQHHTRYTSYLGFQTKYFNINPIITTRNIFDCMVSMDDMIGTWREAGNWMGDPAFSLPASYLDLPLERRYLILAKGYGIWLISFYLSWVRGVSSGVVNPLILNYERDILDKRPLLEKISAYLNFDSAQRALLGEYIERPNMERSRFNRGVKGRGEVIPGHIKKELIDYAREFKGELNASDMEVLFGEDA